MSGIYAVIYIPLMLGPYPSEYRPSVQENMRYVADTFASGGNPYTPPYPDFYSTAGGHLHGVLGAPFQFVFDFPTASRLGVVIMGWASLLLFYTILREIEVSRTSSLIMTGTLIIYPQHVLFHSVGNPSAADIFFGLTAVYTYLRWRTIQLKRWLILSSISAGLATFSHFYSGVVAIGILTHYVLTDTINKRKSLKVSAIYLSGMLPALCLLVVYKVLFAHTDPASHYFDRLIIHSFDSIYASEREFGSGFSVISLQFIMKLKGQHAGKSPIFGNWWLLVFTTATLGSWAYNEVSNSENWKLIVTWIMAGLLIVIVIPGGVIYHDYYTWWLLIGVAAGLALSLDAAFGTINREDDLDSIPLSLLTVLLVFLIIMRSFVVTLSLILSN